MNVQLFLSLLLFGTSILCGCTKQHMTNIMKHAISVNDTKVTTKSDIEASISKDTQSEINLQEVTLYPHY